MLKKINRKYLMSFLTGTIIVLLCIFRFVVIPEASRIKSIHNEVESMILLEGSDLTSEKVSTYDKNIILEGIQSKLQRDFGLKNENNRYTNEDKGYTISDIKIDIVGQTVNIKVRINIPLFKLNLLPSYSSIISIYLNL